MYIKSNKKEIVMFENKYILYINKLMNRFENYWEENKYKTEESNYKNK